MELAGARDVCPVSKVWLWHQATHLDTQYVLWRVPFHHPGRRIVIAIKPCPPSPMLRR